MLIFLLLLIFAVNLNAATYYVATTGNNSNPGTIGSPFLTVNKGVTVLVPGDILYIRGGTYNEALESFTIPGGTSWNSPITISSYPGETAILFPSTSVTGRVLGLYTAVQKYIIVDGLVLDGTNVIDTVKITYNTSINDVAHHIRLINCEIRNAPSQGVLINPASTGGSNEIINCNIHNNGVDDQTHGIYLSSSNCLVERCDIHNNSGFGIHAFSAGSNNIFRYNKVHNNGFSIIIDGLDCSVYYNLIYLNSSYGIKVTANNSRIYNNVIYKNNSGGVYISPNRSDTVLKNNIITQNAFSGSHGDDPVYQIFDFGTGTVISNNIIAPVDPQFIDSTNNDFHLLSVSTAINTGIWAGLIQDFDGNRVPVGNLPDIGAYEYNGCKCP